MITIKVKGWGRNGVYVSMVKGVYIGKVSSRCSNGYHNT